MSENHHQLSGGTMKVLMIIVWLLTIAISLATWLIPFQVTNTEIAQLATPERLHISLAISFAYTLMHFQSVWLFLLGLRHFKVALRRPYLLFCIALVGLAFAQLQLPVAIVFDATWWITSGLLLFLFLAPFVILYLSIRHFAELVGVKSIWMNRPFAFSVMLILPILSLWAPVRITPVAPTIEAAHMFAAMPLWQMGLQICCAYLVWRIKQGMGSAYREAMHWLFLSMVGYALLSAHFATVPYVDHESWYAQNGVYGFILLSTMFIIAGYKFWKIGAPEPKKATEASQHASPLDVVMYTASLATNSSDIDSIMDKVRIVTANLSGNHRLSAQDEATLKHVYLRLEEYLVTREPLRKFSRDELRERINQQFPHKEKTSFWRAMDE